MEGRTPDTTTEPNSTPVGLYPDLNTLEGDDDILTALVEPKRKKPPRPPPPRSQSLPDKQKHFDAILNDDGMDIPGVVAPPKPTNVGVAGGRSQSLGAVPSESIVCPPPLSSEDIRWFYQEPSKFWQPFSGPDSISLEQCYTKLLGGDLTSSNGEVGDVPVMGDLYEVNVLERTCRSVYWTEKGPWPVLRGYWFEVISDKWYPVPEADYRQIEEVHRKKEWREKAKADENLQQWAETVNGSKMSSTSQTDGPVKSKQSGEVILNKLVMERYEVLWMANGDVRKLKKEISTQLWNKVGSKLGKGQSYGATKLVRGYKETATLDEQLAPIGHLVFVIHGIGQSMDMSCINKSTTDFRQTCSQVAKKQFEDKWSSKRVEFIPVEWRTWLSLDKGILPTITPQGVKMLRSLFNESVLDVLYYMSPKFGPEIRDGLRFALQKQYAEFMKRHPYFLSDGGTVSVIAHSLGSVIMYDLLQETCEARGIEHKEPAAPKETKPKTKLSPGPVELTGSGEDTVMFKSGLISPTERGEDEPDSAHRAEGGLDESAARLELEQLKNRVAELEHKLGLGKKPQGLNFFMDHFFALGSPLAVFLMLREHERLIKRSHMSAESLLPSCVCSRIHNVHHPSDPVAYRLEPLINPLYAQIKPVRIDSGSKISKEAVDHAEGQKNKPQLQMSQGKSWFSTLALWGAGSTTTSKKSNPSSPEPGRSKTSEKVADNDKNLKPDGYWTSQDCAQYILLQLYSYKREK